MVYCTCSASDGLNNDRKRIIKQLQNTHKVRNTKYTAVDQSCTIESTPMCNCPDGRCLRKLFVRALIESKCFSVFRNLSIMVSFWRRSGSRQRSSELHAGEELFLKESRWFNANFGIHEMRTTVHLLMHSLVFHFESSVFRVNIFKHKFCDHF